MLRNKEKVVFLEKNSISYIGISMFSIEKKKQFTSVNSKDLSLNQPNVYS
jgi:diketogulonate reductase-like aldo/keto reductase